MSSTRADWVKQLAAVDPAAGLIVDDRSRDETWRVVSAGMRELAPPGSLSISRGTRRLRRVSAVTAGTMLLLVGVAFASGLFSLGSPAQKIEEFQSTTSAAGAIVPGSARLLPLSTPDPQGGPAWGLRVFSTTRGTGCIQVGRVVDGQLGVLGSDGAFGNDGRLHPLSVASTDVLTCSALSADGHIFNNVSKGNELSNGLIGPEGVPNAREPVAHDVCAAAAASAAEKESAQGRICPQSEERDLFYGLLGPDAKSVTYSQGGTPITIPTTGGDGAYLIVEDAPSGDQLNAAYGVGETGVVPVYSPITEIHYSSGAVCHIGHENEPACAPNGIPVGYVPAEPTPTAAQAQAAVSSRLVTGSGGHQEAIITFKAPLAITSARDEYRLQWQKQPGAAEPESIRVGESDVTAGQELSAHSGPLPSGSTAFHVVLLHATGPALFEGPGTVTVPVGTTTVTAP
jgi:hypothetical protein